MRRIGRGRAVAGAPLDVVDRDTVATVGIDLRVRSDHPVVAGSGFGPHSRDTAPHRELVVARGRRGRPDGAVDTTIVVLALPAMERSLHIALAVVWVIVAYILVVTILATQVGRLGDMFGRTRMYELGFLIFVIGSALCATATSEVTIIVFRIVQGVGGAVLTANSGAVLADAFPRQERGQAFGYNSIGWNPGHPRNLLGGLIITYASWRWIFWMNVPTGLLALALALKVLRDDGPRHSSVSISSAWPCSVPGCSVCSGR